MSKKILLLFVSLITTVSSWGFYQGQKLTAADLEIDLANNCIDPTGMEFEVVETDPNQGLKCNLTYAYVNGTCYVPGWIKAKDEGGQILEVVKCNEDVFRAMTKIVFPKKKMTYVANTFRLAHFLEEIEFSSMQDSYSFMLSVPQTLRKFTIRDDNDVVSPFEVLKTEEGTDFIMEKSKSQVAVCLQVTEEDGSSVSSLTFPEGVVSFMGHFLDDNGASQVKTIGLPKSFDCEKFNQNSKISYFSYRYLAGYKVHPENPTGSQYNYATSAYGGILCNSDGSEIIDIPRSYFQDLNTPTTVFDMRGSNVSVVRAAAGKGTYGINTVYVADIPSVLKYDSFASCGLDDIYVQDCTDLEDGFATGNSSISIHMEACTQGHDGKWAVDDDIIYTKDWSTLLICPSSHDFTTTQGYYKVHDGCEEIAEEAFKNNRTLKNIDLNGVKVVGKYSFENTGLTELLIPETVEELQYASFMDCTDLEGVTFENASVTKTELENQVNLKIDGYVFNGCRFESVLIPSRCSKLSGAFYNSRLKTITISKVHRLKSFDTAGSKTWLEHVVFEPGATLDDCAHEGMALFNGAYTDYAFLESVENIFPCIIRLYDNMFANTPKLKTVTFEPNSNLDRINANAFDKCGVEHLVLPDHVTTIERQAFKDCEYLESVDLPVTLSSCDPQAFAGCNNLMELNVPRENTTYSSGDGIFMNKDKSTLIIFPGGKANEGFPILPPTLKEFGPYSFYQCSNLRTLVVPKYVESIGNYAFCGCDNLTDIFFMGEAATAVAIQVAEDNENSDYNLKDHRFNSYDGTVESIDRLKNIHLHYPNYHGTSYSTNSFWGVCTDMQPADHTAYDGGKFDGEDRDFYYVMDATHVILINTNAKDYTYVVPAMIGPRKVSHIADFAFEDLKSEVKEIVFRNHVDYLGANLFKTNIPESVFFAPEDKEPYDIMPSSQKFDVGYDYFHSYITSVFEADGKACYPFKNPAGTSKLSTKIYVPYVMYEDNNKREFNFAYNPGYTYHQLSTQIPLPQITATNSTISREFDIDLTNRSADYNSDIRNVGHATTEGSGKPEEIGNKPDVCAYVSYVKNTKEGDDWVSIVLESVNCGVEGADGTYIPANCGALIQATPGKNYNASFTYEIGMNKSINSVSGNIFNPVCENSQRVTDYYSEGGTTYYNYYLSEGKFWNCPDIANFPIHKAYFTLAQKASASAKALKVFFSQEEADAFAATGIKSINTNTKADVIYDLSGRRVSAPQKGGVYVKNGKKVVL